MKPNSIQILKIVLRFLLGAMFITTAILKLIALDTFELYIYSLNIGSYVFSTFIARVLIAFEFFLGIFLMTKIWYKVVWPVTISVMTGITLFLIYVAISRNDTNCYCFGDLVKLDPLKSIIISLATIAALLLLRKEKPATFKRQKLVSGLGIAVSMIIPFFVFPMDSLYNKIKSPYRDVDIVLFEKLQNDTILIDFNISEGNYIVPVFMAGCQYCKIALKRLNFIVEKHELDKSKIKILVAGGDQAITYFKEEPEVQPYICYVITPNYAIDIVYGRFPTFLLVKDNRIVKAFDYRGLQEKEVVNFLK